MRTFDPAPFEDLVERVRASGIRLVTLEEHFQLLLCEHNLLDRRFHVRSRGRLASRRRLDDDFKLADDYCHSLDAPFSLEVNGPPWGCSCL